MALDNLVRVIVFSGDSGLSATVGSDRDANGTKELNDLVGALKTYYATNYRNICLQQTNGNLLYGVIAGNWESIGTVRITPKGSHATPDRREQEDYPIADPTRYSETYWIYFNLQDRKKSREHREGFVRFIDPTGGKTRRNKQ